MTPAREPVNILLVDDQPAKLLSYEVILEELGENLIRAGSGKEALEHLLKTDMAVVLVDVCMPELDGFELATLIRQHPRHQKTAIILISGILVDDVARMKGYGSGAMDYVSVPIVPEILRAKVSVFADLYRKNLELQRWNLELEDRVAQRTAEIAAFNLRLRLSEERLYLILASSGIHSWTWDVRRDQVRTLAPSAGGEERVLGSLDDFLRCVHPQDEARVRAAFARAAAGEGDYAAEFRVVEGGEQRWFLGRGVVIRDEGGAVASIGGIDMDITERKRSEEERGLLLRQALDARRQAESANRLKDEFLATLSHELRAPLNAIMGWVHLLRAGGLDNATEQKAIDTISRNTELQARLIADILDVSRIITGKLRLDLHPVALSSVVGDALDTVRPAAEAKGIRLEADLGSDGARISGDAARLQQVAWNLLTNAIRFAPRGGHVRVALRPVDAFIEIVVEDDGPGIDPELLPFIFDRFRQGDSSSTRSHHGLGLGLAIVRHLLEMHGGTIEARNRTDQSGAVFRMLLPRHCPPVGRDDPAGATPAAGRSAQRQVSASSLRGVRLLIVDDDPDAREIVAAVLERCGAQARLAGSASEALAMVQDEPPDLLIADIEMPDQDGYSLMQRLRALPDGGATPAIALTGYASGPDRAKALNAGFQSHVTKPVQPHELVGVVASVLGLPEADF
jgi:signal transduction histidine kinase